MDVLAKAAKILREGFELTHTAIGVENKIICGIYDSRDVESRFCEIITWEDASYVDRDRAIVW